VSAVNITIPAKARENLKNKHFNLFGRSGSHANLYKLKETIFLSD
jgi:hypothetical protein